jgi:hypothetical protein
MVPTAQEELRRCLGPAKGTAMKTNVIHHDDGRIEIERVIDDEVMESWKEWNPLAYEASIVWLEDVHGMDFLRAQWVNHCQGRRNKLIPESKGRIVGYSRLTADAPQNPKTGYYTRRVFFLLDGEDGKVGQDQKPPDGTVDPKSILPSVFGVLHGRKSHKLDPPKVKQWESDKKPRHGAAPPSGMLGVLVPLDDKSARILLPKNEVIVGRSEECDVRLNYPNVSKKHCRLTRDQFAWDVVDLNSTGGTFVNGERIPPQTRTRLNNSDTLTFSNHRYRIEFS